MHAGKLKSKKNQQQSSNDWSMQHAGKLKAEAFDEKKATELLDGRLNMRVKKKGSNLLLQENKSINLLLFTIVWCQVHLIYPHVLFQNKKKGGQCDERRD